jgi:hypothetical protein
VRTDTRSLRCRPIVARLVFASLGVIRCSRIGGDARLCLQVTVRNQRSLGRCARVRSTAPADQLKALSRHGLSQSLQDKIVVDFVKRRVEYLTVRRPTRRLFIEINNELLLDPVDNIHVQVLIATLK